MLNKLTMTWWPGDRWLSNCHSIIYVTSNIASISFSILHLPTIFDKNFSFRRITKLDALRVHTMKY